MFSSNDVWIMLTGVFSGLLFIIATVVYVNKLFIHETKDVLVRFIIMVFASLVAVFIVDKIVAFKVELLDQQTDTDLFNLIKTLTLMIFSYYFGTQKGDKSKNPD
jgi:hypothetical protein